MANRLNSLYRDFTGGANNALASTLGAPVDLVNRYTVNQPNALLGSDWIRNKLNTAGIGTQGNGVAGFTGGILGSMAVPGAGLLNAIDTSAQIAQAQTPMGMLLAAGGGLLGEGINALSKPRVMQEMTAYHGSPHDFDEFKLDKIGTGEGAQAYGHGLYFAENPGVAGQYKSALTARDPARLTYDGQVVSTDTIFGRALETAAKFGKQHALQGIDDNIKFNSSYAPDVAEQYKIARAKLDQADLAKTALKQGKLYHVDIPDSAINNMLDWDKPLSEQPGIWKRIQTQAEKAGLQAEEDIQPHWTGREVVKHLESEWGDPAKASARLNSLGIPGIRYLDGGSRGSGTGTRNFVVFDDKLVKVLKKE